MKRLLQAATGLLLGVSTMVGVAAADTVCSGSISGTGTGSTNTVNCVDNQNTTVSCVNNVVVSNTNSQTASSGGAFTVGNTSSGGATSGSSNNSNTVVVNVGESCAPVTTASTPVTP